MRYIEKTTKCGMIRGIENENSYEFRSVKYASANRWEYPDEIKSWDGVYDATVYKECCFQKRSYEDDALCNSFYHKEFRDNMTFKYSEECQYLNIETPKERAGCPVLVFIHGGSFTGGSNNENHISGKEFVKRGVIFVSINYRLGPFGFCSHPGLKDKEGICGNYGLFDQYAALKWIKNNIEDFGGDSKNITLMGQSAGAMSVDIHTSSPIEKDFFSSAALLSGAALQRFILKPLTPEKTRRFWDRVISNAGVNNIFELRKTDDRTLFYAWQKEVDKNILSMPYTLPVYDGKLLTKDSFTKDSISDIPYMIGITLNDMMPFLLKKAVIKWAKICNRENKNSCYTYYFTRALPGDSKGAWHASDLLYFFGTLEKNWRPFEKTDYDLSEKMIDALTSFAKTQDPNCSSVPSWLPDDKKPMIFGKNTGQRRWNEK